MAWHGLRDPRPLPRLVPTFSSARCRSCFLAFSTSEEGPLMMTVSLPEPSTGKWMWTPPHSSMTERIRRPLVPMRELCRRAGMQTSTSAMLACNHSTRAMSTCGEGWRQSVCHSLQGASTAGPHAGAAQACTRGSAHRRAVCHTETDFAFPDPPWCCSRDRSKMPMCPPFLLNP